MTPEQLTALRVAFFASLDPAVIAARTAGDDVELARLYNLPSTFVCWRTDVTAEQTGNAWVGTDIDGMSALNMQRLQLLLASAPSGVFDMSRADRRSGFENPFGTNANNASRVAMRAIWKRIATVAERVFVTGTGTDATPGFFGWQGTLTAQDASDALRA